jgi:3-oxoacyl-[acyl-carrier protein] reductase
MISLTGKVGFISGASGSIGRAIASHLLSLGAKVALSDLNADATSRCARELDPEGSSTLTLSLDVADHEACGSAIESTATHFGGLDFVVTAAGLYLDHPIDAMTVAEWRRSIAVNLERACSAYVRPQRGGCAMAGASSTLPPWPLIAAAPVTRTTPLPRAPYSA